MRIPNAVLPHRNHYTTLQHSCCVKGNRFRGYYMPTTSWESPHERLRLVSRVPNDRRSNASAPQYLFRVGTVYATTNHRDARFTIANKHSVIRPCTGRVVPDAALKTLYCFGVEYSPVALTPSSLCRALHESGLSPLVGAYQQTICSFSSCGFPFLRTK